MEESPRPARLIRFEAYRADLQSGELYNGQKVKLSGQPFEVLAMLLRQGELVTREELRKKLWPEDTFVDFDHGLNTAINKIREALGIGEEPPLRRDTAAARLSLHCASGICGASVISGDSCSGDVPITERHGGQRPPL